MFTVPAEPNQLTNLLSGSINTSVQDQLSQNRFARKNEAVKNAFSKLNEESSPLDFYRAISGIPGLDEQEKKELFQIPELMSKHAKFKQDNGQQMAKQKADSEQAQVLAKEYGLPEELASTLTPQQIQALGKHKNKASPGGITAQATPPEVSQKIEEVVSRSQSKNSDELLQEMDKAGIPRAFSNAYVENRRRQDERGDVREKIGDEVQAKADYAYKAEIPEKIRVLDHRKDVINQFDKISQKGQTGKPYEKVLEKLGLINLTSDGRREAGSLQKEFTKDIRQILGSQFSAQEFFTILNSYPSPDFSKSANDAIIGNFRIWDEIKRKETEVARKLLKENKGKPPFDFELKVADEVSKWAADKVPEMRKNLEKIKSAKASDLPEGFVLMFDPEGGELHVPKDKVEQALKQGATAS